MKLPHNLSAVPVETAWKGKISRQRSKDPHPSLSIFHTITCTPSLRTAGHPQCPWRGHERRGRSPGGCPSGPPPSGSWWWWPPCPPHRSTGSAPPPGKLVSLPLPLNPSSPLDSTVLTIPQSPPFLSSLHSSVSSTLQSYPFPSPSILQSHPFLSPIPSSVGIKKTVQTSSKSFSS